MKTQSRGLAVVILHACLTLVALLWCFYDASGKAITVGIITCIIMGAIAGWVSATIADIKPKLYTISGMVIYLLSSLMLMSVLTHSVLIIHVIIVTWVLGMLFILTTVKS